MSTEDQIVTPPSTVFEALAAVMRDVQGVGKNDQNRAPGGGYSFRGIDAVTNAVGPALRKHRVIVVPEVLTVERSTIEVGQKRTVMSSVAVTIRFTWYGPQGDSIVSVAAGEAFDSGDKATAKAHSVAFRTAMIQTLCLPTDEPDPDSETYERSAAPEPTRPAPAPNPRREHQQQRQQEQAAPPAEQPAARTPADARSDLLTACTSTRTEASSVAGTFYQRHGIQVQDCTDVGLLDDMTREVWARYDEKGK